MSTQVERQPRERAVPCTFCRADTWNLSAICSNCSPQAEPRCKTCNDDPESVEERVYGRNAREAWKPADCPACGARNPLAHGGGYRR